MDTARMNSFQGSHQHERSPESDDEVPQARLSPDKSTSDLVHDYVGIKDKLLDSISTQTNEYDSMVRAKLEEALEGSGATCGEIFPEIYKAVKTWQENLEPLLQEQNSRNTFDLNVYANTILEKLEAGSDQSFTSFDHLVAGQPQWNVSRFFLSALILTNNGNVDILDNTGVSYEFDLRLLDGEKSLTYAVDSRCATSMRQSAHLPMASHSKNQDIKRMKFDKIPDHQEGSES
jgi:hypothetical protein